MSFAPVCIVMVKAPRAGEVKTRLTPPLSSEEAAALAACFFRDTLGNVRRAMTKVIVAYTPSDGRGALEAVSDGNDVLWLEQQGESLGARVEAAILHAAMLGHSPIIVVGTDSPTLPASYIHQAVASLNDDRTDLVLGPTEDGGYYLLGARRFTRNLFVDVAWSTPSAYRQTIDNARRLELRTMELPLWYDVDTFDDLVRLRDEVLANEEVAARAPATRDWLLSYASSLREPA